MIISRTPAATPLSSALVTEIAELNGPCVGCSKCDGLCSELIEALVLPEVILARKRETQ